MFHLETGEAPVWCGDRGIPKFSAMPFQGRGPSTNPVDSILLATMVRHVLLLQPRSGTTPASIEEAHRALAGLVGVIHGLLDFHWGENFAASERQDGYAFGFSMDFLDKEALAAYGPHPEHKIASAKVREAFDRITVFDFEL